MKTATDLMPAKHAKDTKVDGNGSACPLLAAGEFRRDRSLFLSRPFAYFAGYPPRLSI
jgi:hypothetical protein